MEQQQQKIQDLNNFYLMKQSEEGLFGNVIGPNSVSIWVRPRDGRQIVVIGQNEGIDLEETGPRYCSPGIFFIAWYRQVIEPQEDKWKIIVNVLEGKLHFNFNPNTALAIYTRDKIQTTLVMEPKERINYLQELGPLDGNVESILRLLSILVENIEDVWGKSHDITDEQDNKLVAYWVNSQIKEAKQYLTKEKKVSSVASLKKLAIRLNCIFQDVLFVLENIIPALSSDKKNTLIVCIDEEQREILDNVFPVLGFLQTFPAKHGWLVDIDLPSCVNMPEIDPDIEPYESSDSVAIKGNNLMLPCTSQDKEETVARLLSKDPYLVTSDLQWNLRGLDQERLKNIWRKYQLPSEEMDNIVKRLARFGFIQ